jgi:LPXTG-motif cell wall-anchored protein
MTVKHLKRIAVFLFAIFITFAPPGTLIFGAILLFWVIGNVWITVGGALSLAVLAVLLIRRRSTKNLNS